MLRIRWFSILLVFVWTSALLAAGAPSCELKNDDVEKVIAEKVHELAGEEYCDYRIYDTMDDVDGDAAGDFLVVFTIESLHGGSNDHMQFLAVFLSSAESGGQPLIVQVGEQGERDIEAIEVDRHTIVLKTLEYQKEDAMCCPSKKGEAAYRIVQNKLVPAL